MSYFPQDGGLKIGAISTIAAATTVPANSINCMRFAAPMDCVIKNMGAHIAVNSANDLVMFGIYSDSSNAPDLLLGQTSPLTLSGTTYTLQSVPLLAPVRLKRGTKYWLCLVTNAQVGVEHFANYAASGGQKYKSLAYTTSLPSPLGALGGDAGGYLAISGW